MAKIVAKADLTVIIPREAFVPMSMALSVSKRVAELDAVDTFAEFEAKMDRLVEDAKSVAEAMKGRSVLFAFAEDANGETQR